MIFQVTIQVDGNFTRQMEKDAPDPQTAVKQALRDIVEEWEADTHDCTTTIEVLRVTGIPTRKL